MSYHSLLTPMKFMTSRMKQPVCCSVLCFAETSCLVKAVFLCCNVWPRQTFTCAACVVHFSQQVSWCTTGVDCKRLCSRLTALWRCINFVLLLLLANVIIDLVQQTWNFCDDLYEDMYIRDGLVWILNRQP